MSACFGALVEGVAVDDGVLENEAMATLQLRDDGLVGFFAVDALKVRDLARETTLRVEGIHELDARLPTDGKIVLAVGGSQMHDAGAVVGGDEVASEHTGNSQGRSAK